MLPTITNNTALITKTTNKFDVDIDEKNRNKLNRKQLEILSLKGFVDLFWQ